MNVSEMAQCLNAIERAGFGNAIPCIPDEFNGGFMPIERENIVVSESYHTVHLDFSRTYPDEYKPMNHGVEREIDYSAISPELPDSSELIANLVMMIKRLGYSLRRAKPEHTLPDQAMTFLSEKGLISATDCLRESPTGDKVSVPRIELMLPVRDDMGFWSHPNRLKTPFDEDGASTREYCAWFAEQGMEVDFTYMNQIFCEDCVYGNTLENPALHWNPESPAGDGWVLTGIFDTEEGPCAEWLRYMDSDRVVAE